MGTFGPAAPKWRLMSGAQYDRAKFIADHAPQDIIDGIDCGEESIRGTYDAMRAQPKEVDPPTPAPVPVSDLYQCLCLK